MRVQTHTMSWISTSWWLWQ